MVKNRNPKTEEEFKALSEHARMVYMIDRIAHMDLQTRAKMITLLDEMDMPDGYHEAILSVPYAK